MRSIGRPLQKIQKVSLCHPVVIVVAGVLAEAGFPVSLQSDIAAAALAPDITRGPVLLLGAEEGHPALPDSLLWNTLSHSIKLKIAMEAAVFGDKKKAMTALLADPACVDSDIAKDMLDTMIKLQPEHLGNLR